MKQPLIFGEALFDIFPGNQKVLGGAPFNVAWNLAAFGAHPLFVSRIGDDPLGHQILSTMQDTGLTVSGVQIDQTHPTGTVSIEMSGDTHQFNINADQAYDYIDGKLALEAVQQIDCGLLYFGTLAIRSQTSREALEQLLSLQIPVFVDINLRSPWWTQETIAKALDKATWTKLNDEELIIIVQELYAMELPIEQAIEYLYSSLNLEMLVVTCGAKGAYIRNRDQLLFHPAPSIENMKDTVGAGDAFAAVTIFGLLKQWEPEVILARALEFAAKVCSLQGAVSADRGFYHTVADSWHG